MCEIGDLIIVRNPRVNRKPIGQHTFVVLDDSNGRISGMYEYDFVSLLLTSYDDEDEERKKKLSTYDGNLHVSKEDKQFTDEKYAGKNRSSYVEANNFFYFSKEKIAFHKIGKLDSEVFNLIVEFIVELNGKGVTINQILDKAKKLDIDDE